MISAPKPYVKPCVVPPLLVAGRGSPMICAKQWLVQKWSCPISITQRPSLQSACLPKLPKKRLRTSYNSQPLAFSTNHLSSTIPNPKNNPKTQWSPQISRSPKSPSCAQRHGSRAPAVQTIPVARPRRSPQHYEAPLGAQWPLTTQRAAQTPPPPCLGKCWILGLYGNGSLGKCDLFGGFCWALKKVECSGKLNDGWSLVSD